MSDGGLAEISQYDNAFRHGWVTSIDRWVAGMTLCYSESGKSTTSPHRDIEKSCASPFEALKESLAPFPSCVPGANLEACMLNPCLTMTLYQTTRGGIVVSGNHSII